MKKRWIYTLGLGFAISIAPAAFSAEILGVMDNNTVKVAMENTQVGDEFHVYRVWMKEVGRNSQQGSTIIPVKNHIAHGQITQVIDADTALAQLNNPVVSNEDLSIERIN